MQWLVANMWMALAAAAVLGLFFGFSFRGVMSTSRVRKAEIEREIARTELTQSKAEAEALYIAQRKRKEEAAQLASGDETLQAELTERENRIAALGDDLRSARSELETLKAEASEENNIGEVTGAAIAGAVAGAALSDNDQEELTQLRDRNVWLESRIGALETDITAAQSAPETEILAAVAEGEEAEPAPGPNVEKLHWQTTYMRQRVAALESKLIETKAAASVIPIVQEPVADVVREVASEPIVAAEIHPSNQADEELAQLRWRNRYLEGRLAYFEQTPDTDEQVEVEEVVPDSSPDSELAEIEINEIDVETESEAEPEEARIDSVEVPDESVSDPESLGVAEDDVHPSEAMLAELEGTQPLQVDRPTSGGDDLTAITGIGPRIGEVLNSLGIWTFAQIAEWLPEHETWIENHLSFKGRVSRENWVGQAKDQLVSA